jgi:hypothetical protein
VPVVVQEVIMRLPVALFAIVLGTVEVAGRLEELTYLAY